MKRTTLKIFSLLLCIAAVTIGCYFLVRTQPAPSASRTAPVVSSSTHPVTQPVAQSSYQLKWREAIHGNHSLKDQASRALQSNDPNDWALASLLNKFCIYSVGRTSYSDKIRQAFPFFDDYAKVTLATQKRCDGISQSGAHSDDSTTQYIRAFQKAKAQGAVFATMPRLELNTLLTTTELTTLKNLMSDPSAAEIWTTVNLETLSVLMHNTDEYKTTNRYDIAVGLFLALCPQGGCGTDSLMNMQFCVVVMDFCHVQGIEAAAKKKYGEAGAQALKDLGERALYRLRSGEFEALGIRVKPS